MKYMGSKNRLAKQLLPILLKDRYEGQYYVEPFVGGCNLIDKVDGNRIGSDKNELLIEMWKGLQQGKERPLTISKQLYDKAREFFNKNDYSEMDKFTVGWIGFAASFNGRFFDGGYSGEYKGRDYIDDETGDRFPLALYVENVVKTATTDVISKYDALEANEKREEIRANIRMQAEKMFKEA